MPPRRPTPRASRAPAVMLVLVAVAFVAASCSNRESSVNKRPHAGVGTATMVDGVQQITITTGNDLRFHPATITVHPGNVQIVLENKSTGSGGAPHNLQVTGLPGDFVPLTASGRTRMVTFTAPAPGRYKFVCTIHEQQGQNGVLIVEAGAASP